MKQKQKLRELYNFGTLEMFSKLNEKLIFEWNKYSDVWSVKEYEIGIDYNIFWNTNVELIYSFFSPTFTWSYPS